MTSLPDDFETSILLSPLTSNTEEHTIQRSPPNGPAISKDYGHISPYRQPVRWAWAVIIIGQLVILGFGWVFFAVVYHYGPIALPDAMATRAAASQRTVTLVVTLVATALSLVSALYVHYVHL
jgi:biotin transporter BioY